MKPLSGKQLIDSLDTGAMILDGVILQLRKLQHVPENRIDDAVNAVLEMRHAVVKRLWLERSRLVAE